MTEDDAKAIVGCGCIAGAALLLLLTIGVLIGVVVLL
jgi:hypothetical protein